MTAPAMKSVDTNIFVKAIVPNLPQHKEARGFLENIDSEEIIICELMLAELYVVLRNPNAVNAKYSAQEVIDIILALRRNSKWILVENAPVMEKVWEFTAKPYFAIRRIYDVRLALTLQHYGVTEFATANVKDFEGLGFKKVWNPLIS